MKKYLLKKSYPYKESNTNIPSEPTYIRLYFVEFDTIGNVVINRRRVCKHELLKYVAIVKHICNNLCKLFNFNYILKTTLNLKLLIIVKH